MNNTWVFKINLPNKYALWYLYLMTCKTDTWKIAVICLEQLNNPANKHLHYIVKQNVTIKNFSLEAKIGIAIYIPEDQLYLICAAVYCLSN